MGETWPALSYLYIVQKFCWFVTKGPGFSREFLSAITRHFSQSFTSLGLCIQPDIRSALPMSPVRFEKLQLLHLQTLFMPKTQRAWPVTSHGFFLARQFSQ
ncbi:hypothetical protein M407DRAFT_136138 [Tulasnella calospora MUT 4182]|uniref:Uncharacterized protein n=1 Tax=Tulasnella calospora MUT 4182 TaxID=1051891 RepID=A0A0C3QTA0_9AGAM|nr:hypothetical protein M407DRAFT_136138 [Tulasnella calospora MUT 4182]